MLYYNPDYNKKELKDTRRYLRNNSTSAEAVLWLSLKKKQLEGRQFRRQFSVGDYVLDFYCPSEKLCIELDGAPHFSEEGYLQDIKRDEFLKSMGIKVLRIENKHVFRIHDQVLEYIKEHFKK
jgi:very-short-patch-repair endonuclease